MPRNQKLDMTESIKTSVSKWHIEFWAFTGTPHIFLQHIIMRNKNGNLLFDLASQIIMSEKRKYLSKIGKVIGQS